MQQSHTGDPVVIGNLTTSNNYVHVDPSIFAFGDVGYQVIGLASSGSQISNSSVIFPQVPNYLGTVETCYGICNGRTYAWKIAALAPITDQTIDPVSGEVVNTLGANTLMIQSAYKFWNTSTGVYVPYWQAFSTSSWVALNNNHPYKRTEWNPATDGIFSYGYYIKNNFTSTTSGGPFYDRDGYQVLEGKLVEKQLDQFIGFGGGETAPLASFECGTFVYQAVDLFNAYSVIDQSNWPSNLSWFNNGITPSNLACMEDLANQDIYENDWNEWVEDLYEEVLDIETDLLGYTPVHRWDDFVIQHGQLASIVGPNGSKINGISVSSIEDDAVFVEMLNEDGDLKLVSGRGELKPGLYSINLFTSDGNMIPLYYSINKELPETNQIDFVRIGVSPNPAIGDEVNVNINFNKNMSGQLLIHDISGNNLFSKSINGQGNFDTRVELNTNMVQLIVSLVMADGSTKQLQVLKL